jgi:hypothetical protein
MGTVVMVAIIRNPLAIHIIANATAATCVRMRNCSALLMVRRGVQLVT